MEKVKGKIPSGTKEWASSNVNLISGCSHNCLYCYAKKMAIRFGRKTEENWKIMELNHNILKHNFRQRKGRIMFPTSHDIVPEFKEECFLVLEKLLESNNSVLITSKPHYQIVEEICKKFIYFRDLIQFRFTITSHNNKLLLFWEGGAPLFEERKESLKYAFKRKFKTSVSIEPFLDKNPIPLIEEITPYVTETIWLGKMNYIKKNDISTEEKSYFEAVRKNYSFENIQNIIDRLNRNKKIRYKDSIKKLNVRIPNFQTPNVKSK